MLNGDPRAEQKFSQQQAARILKAVRHAERHDRGQFNAPPRPDGRGPFPTGPAVWVVEVTGTPEASTFGPKGLSPAVVRVVEFKYSVSDPAEHGVFWTTDDDDPDISGVEPCWATPFDGAPAFNVGDVGIGFVVDEYRADEDAAPVPIFVVAVSATTTPGNTVFAAQVTARTSDAEPDTIYSFRRVKWTVGVGWAFDGAEEVEKLVRLPRVEPSPTGGVRPRLAASATILLGDIVPCWANPDEEGKYLCDGEARTTGEFTKSFTDPETCVITTQTVRVTGAGLTLSVS